MKYVHSLHQPTCSAGAYSLPGYMPTPAACYNPQKFTAPFNNPANLTARSKLRYKSLGYDGKSRQQWTETE